MNHSMNYYFNLFSKKTGDYVYFIKSTRSIINNYQKSNQKIIFLSNLLTIVNTKYERHLIFCSCNNCRFVEYYQHIIFYLQSEMEFFETSILESQLSKSERYKIKMEINSMIKMLDDLKEKNINKYSYFASELRDMKNYFYLDKKIWKELFIGKIYELENSDIINMTHRKILLSKINFISKGFSK